VRRADRLDEGKVRYPLSGCVIGKILLQLTRDAASDLRNLDRVSEPVTVKIAVAKIQDLRLAL
jgi:hypothetical protein